MATKIRLQRHGKKRSPFYHIVIADSRAKRDGKFIEKIGTYNPNTKPATTPPETSTPLPIATGASPPIQDSLKLKAEPTVLTSMTPTSKRALALAVGAINLPKCSPVETFILFPDTE